MTEAQLIQTLNKAQMLMNNDSFNSLVESKSKNVNFDHTGNIVMDKRENLSHEELVNEFSNSRSTGLPREIMESFNRQPTPEMFSNRMDSVMGHFNTAPKKTQIVNENASVNYQNANIDYSIIKAIVNECISSQLNNIKESIINENTVRGFTFKDGNKVQFISKNGDLYEGELKLKKRKK